MKRKLNYIVLLLVLSLSVTSCSEKFFDLAPANEVTTKNLFNTAEDFDLAVIGAYAKLQSQVDFYTELSEYRSDNLELSAPTTGTQDRYDIDQFRDKPSNGILQNAWGNFNNGVYRANIILDKLDGAEISQEAKNQYKGEALFLRALTYFNMYRIWGGVPTTDRVVSPREALSIGRSSDADMQNFIVSDLKTIVDNQLLPASYNGANVGRATIGATQALLGKVYLTFGRYEEAREVLSKLIGAYELVPLEELFIATTSVNKEVIFAVRFNKAIPSEGHGAWFSIGNMSDENNQTEALLNAFEPNDKRRELIEYRQSEKNLYLLNKYFDTRDPSTRQLGNDQIILRYADVLLMYAEALNEISFSDEADSEQVKAVNLVRHRAGLGDVDPLLIKNKEGFRRMIMHERQCEFPYEGHRWYDIVRMGFAKEVMAANGHDIEDYQLLYPIPKSAIEKVNNPDLLWQNPGY